MICKRVRDYCCEDPSLIENYELAVNDTTTKWEIHHRLEIQGGRILSGKELDELGLYLHRPASELIFMTPSDHRKLHGQKENKKPETSRKRGEKNKSGLGWNKKKKYKNSAGEIVYMRPCDVVKYHKDWIKIEDEQ